MYSKILKELKKADNLKDKYIILRDYTRLLDLSYNQVEYLLHSLNN